MRFVKSHFILKALEWLKRLLILRTEIQQKNVSSGDNRKNSIAGITFSLLR